MHMGEGVGESPSVQLLEHNKMLPPCNTTPSPTVLQYRYYSIILTSPLVVQHLKVFGLTSSHGYIGVHYEVCMYMYVLAQCRALAQSMFQVSLFYCIRYCASVWNLVCSQEVKYRIVHV